MIKTCIFPIKQVYGNFKANNFSLDDDGINYKLSLENISDKAVCTICQNECKHIHQITKRTIVDTLVGKIIYVTFSSRKFKCTHCNHIFTESTPFTIGKFKYSTRFIRLLLQDHYLYSITKQTGFHYPFQFSDEPRLEKYPPQKRNFFQSIVNEFSLPITTYDSIINSCYTNKINLENKKYDYCLNLPFDSSHQLDYYNTLIDKQRNTIDLAIQRGKAIEIVPAELDPNYESFIYVYKE